MESIKKIALITPLSGAYSGAHEYLLQLKTGLEKLGHTVDVFSIEGTGKCPIPDTQRLAMKRNPSEVQEILGMYDYVHFTSVSENTKEDPRFLELADKIPFFATIHACEHDLKLANRWQDIIKHAKGIIFTSEGNRQYYIKNYPELVREDNSFAVDMPFCPTFNVDVSKVKNRLAICTARFISYKKIREFLSIAKSFPHMNFKAITTVKTGLNNFVGGMMTKSYYEKIMKEIAPNAEIVNYPDIDRPVKEVKREFLERARYMIDMSSFEIDKDRVQYTTLEAMDNGCVPIFHSNFFGSSLVKLVNGLPANDPSQAVSAITILEGKPELRNEIITNNLEFLKERYGGSINIDKYLKIYAGIKP